MGKSIPISNELGKLWVTVSSQKFDRVGRHFASRMRNRRQRTVTGDLGSQLGGALEEDREIIGEGSQAEAGHDAARAQTAERREKAPPAAAMATQCAAEKFRPVTSHVGLRPASRRRGRSPPLPAAFAPQSILPRVTCLRKRRCEPDLLKKNLLYFSTKS